VLEGRYRWWLAVRAGRCRRRCSAPLQATPPTLTRAVPEISRTAKNKGKRRNKTEISNLSFFLKPFGALY